MLGKRTWMKGAGTVLAVVLSGVWAGGAVAQTSATHPRPMGMQGSSNIHVLAHLPLGPKYSIADMEIDQDMSRPFAFVSRRVEEIGYDVLSLEDPENPEVIFKWRIENPDLHTGGAMDAKTFKHEGRHYFVQATSFGSGRPDADVAAIVFDVTGLPDPSLVREVGRIRPADGSGGFHNIFMYKHSDGRPILLATHGGAQMYDLGEFLAGDADQGYIGTIGVPPAPGDLSTTYHDLYAAFDPVTQQDKFYGAGGGGYYVFDISRPDSPELLVTITGVAGFNWGHTFTPTPDGRYAIGEAEWQYQPLRFFDLKPGLDAAARGELININRPIGAWTPDWETVPHNQEVRWPYVFVSGYETGLSVVNMMDPTNPYTVGYYDTFDGPHAKGTLGGGGGGNYTWPVYDGAFGIDVRNADGLIVVSDFTTGFWAFRMDGFDGWNGNDWGMPNSSSAQDWDNGPDGVQRPISE